MLTVAVLGPVEVRRDGGRLTVPSGKTTEVLVRLALDAGRPVRAERIIEDLWADAAGRNTLQSKISQLRRALGDAALITAAAGGYTLELAPDRVDALRVAGLAAAAGTARRSGDDEAALEAATEALALFRGDTLAEAGDGDWLQPHRARLEELRLGLVEDRLAALVGLGTGGDVIGELEALVRLHPVREGLWRSLITALYRAGRQADALAAYTRVREVLAAELGLEPGPELRGLETQILRQSIPVAVPVLRMGNLPALSSPLVGRAGELAELDRLLRERRLVTLVGPAGVGKTRTAIEAARRIDAPGGVWLVRLDAADPATSLVQMVAETLQLAGGEQLFERLGGTGTVLVLDNCEHVVDGVADLAARLLDAAPRLRVLATSQLPLGLDGEAVHTLEPLPIADSITLFARRAAETRRQFTLEADAATVEEVCRALDGLPLAIELAAARVKTLSVREIARRLDDRFALLRNPTGHGPERRRALAAAIGWSYELLFPDDQRGLWALSCFAGGAPLAAAEHVLGALGVPAASVVDVVGRLADRSLVSVEFAEDGAVRYRLLDSIRAFALDRLRAAARQDTAAAAHAAWFAAAADRCAATVRGPAQGDCLALVRAERANIDAALAWSAGHDPALGLRIANGFGWTWVVLGDGVAGAARLRTALDGATDGSADGTAPDGATSPAAAMDGATDGSAVSPGPAPDGAVAARDRVTALLLAGWLEASAGDVARADADLGAARELAVHLADRRLCADAERHLAFLRIQQGRPHEVLELAGASLAVYRPLGLPWETAAGLLLAAFGAIMLGDTAAAARSAGEALGLVTPLGDAWGLVHAEAMLGAVAQAEHRFAEAAGSLARAAAAAERLGFLGQASLHLTTLGRVQHRAGDPATAVATLHRAIAAANDSGDLRITATARVHLARIHRAAGAPAGAAEAVALLEENDRWYRASGGGDGALLTRGLLAAARADTVALRAVLDEAAAGDREVRVLASDALALAAARVGDTAGARALLAAADELAAGVRHAVDEVDRADARAARALL